MKVFLAFNYQGINHEYHWPLWQAGIAAMGWELETEFNDADIAIMWGVRPEYDQCQQIKKPFLVVDFPYWNRGWKVRNGLEYYKVSLNGQHPTEYVMQETLDHQRYIDTKGPVIRPWQKKNGHILLAGMGVKAAGQYGLNLGEWEARAARAIQKKTPRQIIYRPKPRIHPAPPIPGTTLDNGNAPVDEAIRGAYAVVCHHGNPTVEALAEGIPIFMNGKIGVASHFASFELDKINEPIYPEGREQFFFNLAHWQWSVAEIKSGKVLQSYKARGLI